MNYLTATLIFLIPSLGMVAGLSVAATVTIFLLMLFLRGINSHYEQLKGAWPPHKAGLLRLLRQSLQFFLAMTIKTELLFVAWCFISCLFGIHPINSLVTFAQVFILLFLGFIVSHSAPFRNRLQFKKALILGILTAILLFFIEYSSHGFLTRMSKTSFGLYMLDRGCALLSITSWVAIIILLSSCKRRNALMLYILVLYLLSISDSLASFVGFSISGVIFILARVIKPIFFKLIAISLITGTLLFPVIAKQIEPQDLSKKYLATQPSAAHRLFIWHFVANKIIEKPILGYGFASSKHIKVNNSAMINHNGEKWHPLPLHPHNNILQITLELGTIGLILFLCLVYKYLKQISNIENNNFKAISYACFINYYIIGMISYNIWQIWWISSGILVPVLMKLLVKPDIVVDN
nr:O-antigen ligase [Rickettsia akari]